MTPTAGWLYTLSGANLPDLFFSDIWQITQKLFGQLLRLRSTQHAISILVVMKNVFRFYFFINHLFFNLLLKSLSHLYRWILYATSASTPVGLHERYYIANHLSGCLMLAVSGYWPKVITGSLHRLYLLPSFRKFPKKLWCQKKISVFLFLLPRIIMKEVMRNLIKKKLIPRN